MCDCVLRSAFTMERIDVQLLNDYAERRQNMF